MDGFIAALLFAISLGIWGFIEGVDIGREEVLNGEVKCEKDIAGEWVCIAADSPTSWEGGQ